MSAAESARINTSKSASVAPTVTALDGWPGVPSGHSRKACTAPIGTGPAADDTTGGEHAKLRTGTPRSPRAGGPGSEVLVPARPCVVLVDRGVDSRAGEPHAAISGIRAQHQTSRRMPGWTSRDLPGFPTAMALPAASGSAAATSSVRGRNRPLREILRSPCPFRVVGFVDEMSGTADAAGPRGPNTWAFSPSQRS